MVSDPGSSRAEAEIGGSSPTPISDVLFGTAVPATAAVTRTKAAKEMLAAVLILLFCVQNLDADVVIESVVLDTSG